MGTTHDDQTPYSGPVEWRAAPPVATDQVPTDHATAYPDAIPAAPAAPPATSRGKIITGVAALLIAVGGTTGYLVSHASSGSSTSAATAQGGTAGGIGTAGGAGGGGMGFQPTQYHIDGTITAIGNGTVTVKLTSGTTTTYTVTSSTHLMANGTTASSLSSFKVGDTVRGSTTTQGGTTLNDMVSGDTGGTGTRPDGSSPQGTGANS